MNDALAAALAGADDLISARQVFRDDLQRRVLDIGIGQDGFAGKDVPRYAWRVAVLRNWWDNLWK